MDGPWPLRVSQRCLGILARVLLGRQQKSLHKESGMDIPECVAVWKRLINTLRDFSLQGEVPYMQGISSLLIKLIHKNKGSMNTALLS